VVTTSGTAAAHLHAAVLEASAGGVPLVALTADRPPELRGVGANQTIEQAGLYGGAVRWSADAGVPEEGRAGEQNRYWRSLVARALLAARGALSGDPGPVHLNLPLRDPLLPGAEAPEGLPEQWCGRPDGAPWTTALPAPGPAPRVAEAPRTLVVAGDAPPALGRAAAEVAERCGWPVLAEPSSGAWGAPTVVRAGALLVAVAPWLAAHRPERVLVVGRPTLSRPVSALLADPRIRVDTVAATPRWADAGRGSATVSLGMAAEASGALAEGWLSAWREAGARVGDAVDAVLDLADGISAARLARDLVAVLPAGALLVLGSSTPVRDVDRLARPRGDLTVLANRGVAGIDGTVSTALGAALAHGGPAAALLGDLTLLHDLQGLLGGDGEPLPDLTLVVPDNDGGGIFAQLEPGEERHAADYRRVFGTPHGRDLVAVAEALGWPATAVGAARELPAALAPGGPRVVVVRTDQHGEARLAGRLREAAARALR
jgi:2-succinyl-5-enolpyruvyl-6-hydroxy-3-cyclohexene-1-carboxylate synthase